MNYKIVPLVLASYIGEKGFMTFLTDYGSAVLRPFVMWYVEGAEKSILVDTAIEAEDYKNYHPKFKELEIEHKMSFEAALNSVGLSTATVDIVIQTHLHFDHCFNSRKCINAKVIVQENELKFARNPVPFEGIYRKDLFESLNYEIIKGDHKLLPGITILSTPGHSPGGQSVCVQTAKGKAVISGLCCLGENFSPKFPNPMAGGGQILLPGIMANAVAAYNSMLRIKQTADIILPLHDPEILNIKEVPY